MRIAAGRGEFALGPVISGCRSVVIRQESAHSSTSLVPPNQPDHGGSAHAMTAQTRWMAAAVLAAAGTTALVLAQGAGTTTPQGQTPAGQTPPAPAAGRGADQGQRGAGQGGRQGGGGRRGGFTQF